MLGDSAAETATIMVPGVGLLTAVGTRVSNQAEEFEDNNGRAPTAGELSKMTLTNMAVLGAERFIIKSGIKNVKNALTKGGKVRNKVAGIAGSTGFEAAQEYADYIQETHNTQKIGEKTLGEIATSDEAKLSALAGGTMGGALRGAGESLTVPGDTLKGAKELNKKRIYDKNQRQTAENLDSADFGTQQAAYEEQIKQEQADLDNVPVAESQVDAVETVEDLESSEFGELAEVAQRKRAEAEMSVLDSESGDATFDQVNNGIGKGEYDLEDRYHKTVEGEFLIEKLGLKKKATAEEYQQHIKMLTLKQRKRSLMQ